MRSSTRSPPESLIAPQVHVPALENSIANRLNKTQVERDVDHEQEKIGRVNAENAEKRAIAAQ